MSLQTVDITKKPLSRYPNDRFRTSKGGTILTPSEEAYARKYGMN